MPRQTDLHPEAHLWYAVLNRNPNAQDAEKAGYRPQHVIAPNSAKANVLAACCYMIVESPLGALLVAATNQGLCNVRLGETASALEQELQQEFQNAVLQPANNELQCWTQTLVAYLSGICPLPELPIDVKATAFQLQVWEALQLLPLGTTASYSHIACQIGQPTAIRAVARACATNPVALVIPCHRVVQKDGGLGGYRWGVHRKQELLNIEANFAHNAT